MRQASVPALAVLAAVLGTGCHGQPKCSGELEPGDLRRLQELASEGKYPCAEHLEPVIVVDRDGVTLGERRVARADQLPSGAPRRIAGLFGALKSNREIWKQVNPGEMFAAHPKVRIDGACDVYVGASVLVSTAYAGYPEASVSSGNVSFDMSYAVPGPPSPDAEPRPTTELRVTHRDPDRYSAVLLEGSVVKVASPDLAFDQVSGWVARQCTGVAEPCAQVLALDLRGEFVGTAALIRSIEDGPGFKTRPPRLRFVMPGS